MNPTKQQKIVRIIILILVFITPLTCMFFASLRYDPSGLRVFIGFITGVLALIGSAILGPINSHIIKYQEKPYLSLLGYIAPAVVAILYTIIA